MVSALFFSIRFNGVAQMASEDVQNRQQMRVTLIGIRPADQVTLKGYMRVLLRLDVELVWVSANELGIHLFMINNEFRQALSVNKLLATNKGVPVLYVNRDDNDVGSLRQNLLTIPLNQIALLNDWLVRNVPLLSESGLSKTKTSTTQSSTKSDDESNQSSSKDKTHSEANLTDLIDMIELIQHRSKSVFELVEGCRVIALIDTDRQRLWIKNSVNKINADMRLRAYGGSLPDVRDAKDANHWLWQLAWHNPEMLLPFVENNKPYQLRFWAKPIAGEARRDLLRIMTAMEGQALTIAQIAGRANVSVLTAKKAVASLLFAGFLMPNNYKHLKELVKSSNSKPSEKSPTPTINIEPEPMPEPIAPPPSTEPQSKEKMGFLARLRKTLGL